MLINKLNPEISLSIFLAIMLENVRNAVNEADDSIVRFK